jgi:hypothetical protein
MNGYDSQTTIVIFIWMYAHASLACVSGVSTTSTI